MSRKDPIAIIGIGCRFPGSAHGPDAFWDLLRDGVDAVSEVPADRWNIEAFYDSRPGQKGKSISRWMGALDAIDRFDAGFFGVSPREAECMDPQQRLLLQTAWEAMDDGGEVLDLGNGSDAGVFVGISTYDYALLQSTPDNQSAIDVYTGTGGAMSVAANRLSHCLNLRGPSLAVDTACSSSLVALHLACRSLWQGECPLAFVGGVNAIVSATTFIGFSQSGMLSPDGRCKAFDASANGFVRAEGCGVVLLKPLSAALADGNPIYAVVRGTAANQDGRTNGISVPSAAAQEALVREACHCARVAPASVQYVEAHGTGTLVGDPIEATALGSALCDSRDADRPLLIGSVKTNIGHLEAGAGIAGLIKTALALKRGQIPPSLHFKNPNPQIDFDKLKLRVVDQVESFRNGTELPIAGVNSFGFGGTNAHAILHAFSAPSKVSARRRRRASGPDFSPSNAHLLSLSARSEESLRGLAEKYVAFLSRENLKLDDVCFTAGAYRTFHPHRLCLAATDGADALEKLNAYLVGESRPGLSSGSSPNERQPVFVFSGQGPQWWAMGRQLLEQEPMFRRTINECDAILREFADWSLLEEMMREESSSRMQQTAIAQPAIFALQVALAALWQSWGIRPAACVGHSVGEVAAAHVAGVLSLREAARVIFHRGRCMELAKERGQMIAAALTTEEAQEIIAPWNGSVSLAAINSPNSVTLSGEADAIDKIVLQLDQRSIFCRRLRVNYAFHSRQMEPVREELLRALGSVETSNATLELFSTVTGSRCKGAEFAAEYWWRNVRMPVRFAPAIDALIDRGHSLFLEISPHPALAGSLMECMTKRAVTGTALTSLRRAENERLSLLSSLGALHAAGGTVNWRALYPDATAVRLPSYAWRDDRYWHEAPESRESRLAGSPHPLLARRTDAADPTWRTRLDLKALSYLPDHLVQEHVVFPAAGYVEMALGAAHTLWDGAASVIEEIDFQKALVLKRSDEVQQIQLCCRPQDSTFTISSSPGAANWTLHCAGKIRASAEPKKQLASFSKILVERATEVSRDSIYERFSKLGLPYGPAFRCIQSAWCGDRESFGRIALPASLETESGRYRIHPAMLDACFQLLLLTVPSEDSTRETLYLPVQISRLHFFMPPGTELWCHARLRQSNSRAVIGDLTVSDGNGRVFLEIESFRCQAVNRGRSRAPDEQLLYQSRWKLDPASKARSLGAPVSAGKIRAQVEPTARRIRAETTAECDVNKLTAVLDPLCGFYILDALRQLGWKPRRGERVTAALLARRLHVASRHRQVFARFLSFLEADGILVRANDGWKVPRGVVVPSLDTLWCDALAKFPSALAELTLIRACGSNLAAVLRGDADPLKLIFPDGSLAVTEHLYQDSVSFRGSNRLVGETISAVVAQLPENRSLRILEIGAGTGGMTSHVLPRLPADRAEYIFSDVSNLFLGKAEQKFFEFPFVRYRLFDVEKPPREQEFEPHSFDVILASDAIHATADLRKTLANIRDLLVPGGIFVLLEVDHPARWADLVFGLTDGWWRFTDSDLRPSYPLLRGPQWLALLRQIGFAEPQAIPDRSDSAKARQAIFLAGTPPDTAQPASSVVFDLRRNGHRLTWLLCADESGTADDLAVLLRQRGDEVVTIKKGDRYRRIDPASFEANPASRGDLLRVIDSVRKDFETLSRVVHFWSLDCANPTTPLGAQAENCHSLLHLVQAMTADAAPELPRLSLVTRGAQPVTRRESVAVLEGPVQGLAGVIANEHPKLRCQTIDLAPTRDAGESQGLFDELIADDNEDQVALRGGARFLHRIARASIDSPCRNGKRNRAPVEYRVEIDNPGALDHLIFREHPVRKPGPDEIVFKVNAAALNFRDVMKALGIYPGDNDDDALLGDECSGEIVTVGRNVTHLRIGDAVLAIVPGAFASHVTIPAALVVRKPRNVSHPEAATIPIAFLTAWHALHALGGMGEGSRVLIQAATGGVGLAALQLARLAKAEIFATAGSVEKRAFLRAQGIQHVMDSRSLAFADEIRAITNGRGVDLVLNSLSGDAIEAGLSVLATGGRFLEIGKRDIYQNSRIGLRPLRNNASFHVIDLAQLIRDNPAIVSATLKKIMPLFASGKLRPLPHRLFEVTQISAAFRHMSQARHIGKIAVSMESGALAPVLPAKPKPVRFRSNGSYLITGGLGGFGLAVAEWLLKNGAGHVVLASRSGAATDPARRAVNELKKLGRVLVLKADVSRERDVARIFRTIAQKLPPLRGIMHAAMVLDDGVLAQQTAERFDRVMAPKVGGAWNLHLQSKGLPLDFFVLFSSIATIAGSPGQGGYVAANCFLESLAHHRRAIGLPALAINWGVISEVGFVARNAKVNELLARNGLHGITPSEALAILGQLLQREEAQFAIGRVDWRRLADSFPVVGTSLRYAEVVEAQAVDRPATDGVSFRDEIGSLAAGERLAAVTRRLKEQIAKVLRTSEAKLDPTRPLSELGLDSLMGVELLNRIETNLGISLPAGHLAAGTSISTMAAQILETITGQTAVVRAENGTIAKVQPPASSLVPLRPGGSATPLFCLHSAGGLVNVYENLVRHIPADVPVFGLQSRAVLENGSERGSLSEMASDYASLIQAQQPFGPIRLLGFSFGGFVAMAVASALERAGRSVEFIGLIDADLRWTEPDYLQKQSLADHISELYRTFTRELKLLQPLDDDSLRSFAGSVSAEINEAPSTSRVENVLRAVVGHGYVSPGLPQSLLRHYLTLFFAHLDYLGGHPVEVVRAPLTVWSGRETKNESGAWRQFTENLVTENFIDGAHYDLMYSPLVERLATKLSVALEPAPTGAANGTHDSVSQRPGFPENGHGVVRSAPRTPRGDDVPLHVE